MANYDTASRYYDESQSIFEEIGLSIGLAYVTGNRALIDWKKGDREKAKNDLFKAIDMLEPLGDQFGMADYYIRISTIYFEEGNREDAIKYAQISLEKASNEGMKEQIRDATYLLHVLYESRGEFEKALGYQSLYYSYKDSIQNNKSTLEIANLRTQFEVGQKQSEIDQLLQKANKNQLIMLIGGLIVLIVFALLFYANYQSKVNLLNQLKG
jgi:tetratricopeptide (TPR) repeat protein